MSLVRCPRRSTGALITEVLIALALLVPVVVLVAGMFPYSFSIDARTWNTRTAQSLARSAFEKARGEKFEDLIGFNEVVTRNNTPFTIDVRVTPIEVASPAGGTAPPDVREKVVVCTVTWPRNNGTDTLLEETRIPKLFQPRAATP